MPSHYKNRKSRSRDRSRNRYRSRSRSRSKTRRYSSRRSRSHSTGRRSRSRDRKEKKHRDSSYEKHGRSSKGIHTSKSQRSSGNVNQHRYSSEERDGKVRRDSSSDREPMNQRREETSQLSHKEQASAKRTESPSPTHLDDLLLNARPLLVSRSKVSLFDRYEEQEINVISIHSKGKSKRSQSDIDGDESQSKFSSSEMIDLFHELNPKSAAIEKRPRPIFDREEIKNPPKEEVETQVIRLLPSQDDLRKLEDKIGIREADKREQFSRRHGKSSRSEPVAVFRDRVKKYDVTDSDLLDEPPSKKLSYNSSKMDAQKKSVRDRLGSANRPFDDRTRTDRYGMSETSRSEASDAMDLRHNLSKSKTELGESSAPVVKDYGHKSAEEEKRPGSNHLEDFSRRPDKGKVDPSSFDPTKVRRGAYYDEHDDRDRNQFRGRGRGGGFRGGFRARGGFHDHKFKRNDYYDRKDRDKFKDKKRNSSDTKWKHDKFSELESELDRTAEPSSTTN